MHRLDLDEPSERIGERGYVKVLVQLAGFGLPDRFERREGASNAAGPGTLVRLRPGDYPAFGIGFHHAQHWNARTSGGAPGRPVVVKAEGGRVRVVPEDRGDTLSINVTYDVRKASWYESMGIMPLAWSNPNPGDGAMDPFADEAAVNAVPAADNVDRTRRPARQVHSG